MVSGFPAAARTILTTGIGRLRSEYDFHPTNTAEHIRNITKDAISTVRKIPNRPMVTPVSGERSTEPIVKTPVIMAHHAQKKARVRCPKYFRFEGIEGLFLRPRGARP
jgi:hypothetical protein